MPDGARRLFTRRTADHSQYVAGYHQPGTGTDIYGPIANAAAAMNYVMARCSVLRDGSNAAAAVCQFDPNCGPFSFFAVYLAVHPNAYQGGLS
jgi:hypothetical protein